jgi:hypothetical protein
VGAEPSALPVEQPLIGRQRLCVPGGSVEPVVSADDLLSAIAETGAEPLRALLPVGYAAGVEAYRQAVLRLTAADLTGHYTAGLDAFHEEFVPHLKERLRALSGNAWDLSDFMAYAAGSDVDLMTHLVEAVAAREEVCLYPGDWFGFRVGCTHPERVRWTTDSRGRLACLCIPSVRNGHVTAEMIDFLTGAEHALLNLNLYPTLEPAERHDTARALAPLLGEAVLSISFSRGFGLTASQLGVFLVHRDHPLRRRFEGQWQWYTYFHNALAARAFLAMDEARRQEADGQRRRWVRDWLAAHGLPVVESGSYYVKAFRLDGAVPDELRPLTRDAIVRLCFKPPLA